MRLQIVTGPPCSGKSSLIEANRAPGDVVVDLDGLAVALGHPGDHVDWDLAGEPHGHLARAAWAAVIKTLLSRHVKLRSDAVAWIIDTNPERWQVATYRRAGATLTELDPGVEECHRRAVADSRPPSTHNQIDQWYSHRPGGASVAAEFFA